MYFDEKVKYLAAERGWSQADFARASGMSTAQVNHLFNKTKDPRMSTIILAANSFGISVESLLEGVSASG